MRKISILLLALVWVVSFSIVALAAEEVVTINFYGHAPEIVGVREGLIQQFEAEHPNIKVNLVSLPDSTDDKLKVLNTLLQAQDPTLDVFDADVVWPAFFAAAGWVEPLDEYFTETEREKFLQGPIQANIYMGHIYGVPKRTDAGILLYRKDLLDKYGFNPPETWDNLVKICQTISEKEGITGFVGQWAQHEGLTCNALEFVWGNGARVLDDEGNVVLNDPKAVEALQFMVDMIHKYKISPEGMTTYKTGDSRAIFLEGRAVFHRAWPKDWAKSQDPKVSKIAGKIGVTIIPRGPNGTTGAATLGGWQLMISSFSQHKKEAWEFVKFRTNYAAQKLAAIGLGLLPTIEALYEDKQVLYVNPYWKEFQPIFINSFPRPRSPFYPEISDVLQIEFQNALTLRKSSAQAITDAAKQIEEILKR